MIHILARRIALFGIESSNPYVVPHESGPPTGKAVFADKRRDSVVGFEPVRSRPSDMILHVGVDDLPVAHRLRIGAPTSRQLRLQHGGLVVIGVTIAVVRSLALRA